MASTSTSSYTVHSIHVELPARNSYLRAMMVRIAPVLLLCIALLACDKNDDFPPIIDCEGSPMVFFDEASSEVSPQSKTMLFNRFNRPPGSVAMAGPTSSFA